MAVFNRNKVFITGIVVMVLLAACQPASIPVTSGSSASVTITAQDFSFNIPDQVQAGVTTFTMQNDGKESHHAQFFRLNENVTLEQFTASLQKNPEEILALASAEGGPGPILPGQKDEVMLNLEPGQYVLVCFLSGADGVPHLAKGMVKPFQVVAKTGGAAAAEPQADATATLKDFTIELPSSIPAGRQVWKVTNNGPQPHEMGILKLAAGKSLADVEAFMANPQGGPPPFEDAGGMQALSPGKSAWVILDLQPGDYLALCFVPDPATGKPHAELGMITPFTVK